MSVESRNELIDKIENWFREQGYQFNVVRDDAEGLNLTFWSMPQIRLNLIIKNDNLLITTIMNFTREGVERLSKISPDSRRTFEQDLHLSLSPIEADHEFVCSNKTFVGVKVYKVIFADGLSKTKFFDTVSAVLHSVGVINIKHIQLTVRK